MKQKFRKFSFVWVKPEPRHWSTRKEHSFEAIVDGSYLQLYLTGTEDDLKRYALFKLERGEIVDHLSWYHEDSLTLLPTQSTELAEELLEQYMLKENRRK